MYTEEAAAIAALPSRCLGVEGTSVPLGWRVFIAKVSICWGCEKQFHRQIRAQREISFYLYIVQL